MHLFEREIVSLTVGKFKQGTNPALRVDCREVFAGVGLPSWRWRLRHAVGRQFAGVTRNEIEGKEERRAQEKR